MSIFDKLKKTPESKDNKGTLETQKQIIDQFYSELQTVGASNKMYNLLGNKINEKLGPIKVSKMNEDASILVHFEDPSALQGRVDIVQLTINLNDTGKEIHFFVAPYGPDEYFNLEQKATATKRATDYVKNFRLYHE